MRRYLRIDKIASSAFFELIKSDQKAKPKNGIEGKDRNFAYINGVSIIHTYEY